MATQLKLPKSKYAVIKSNLRKTILGGKVRAGDRFYSESDICKQFSVSSITARRVLNDLVSEGLVIRKRGSGSYVNDINTQKKMLFGMIFPSVTDGHSGRLLHRIERLAAKQGYAVVVQNSEDKTDSHLESCRTLAERGVDGAFIYVPSVVRPDSARDIIEGFEILESAVRGIVVFEGNQESIMYKGRICAVHEDYKQAGFDLTMHLLREGHQYIACCDNEHCYTTNQRFFGYWQALHQAGVEFDQKYHLKVNDNTPEQLVDRLLSLSPKPTAILALSDFHARQLYEVFRRRGIKIPDDIAVAGYDNLEFTSLIEPPLTTIEPPSELIAKHAFDLMFKMLNTPDFSPINIVIPARLIIRESTKK